MKYILIGLSLILFASCKKSGKIEFSGNVAGVKSGTFLIKTLRDSTLFGENIKDGKFQTSGMLPHEGYYTMDIVDDANKDTHDRHFEVYLEGGKYTIETAAATILKYPKITTSSKTQNDLSAYYTLLDQQSANASLETAKLKAEIEKLKHTTHSPDKFNGLVEALATAQGKESATEFSALKLFAKQYPQSNITAHLMSNMDYDAKPADYYDVFKTFSDEAKASTEGKEIDTKLSHLVKLLAGAQSPDIIGNTPDGKPFSKSSVKKKIILLDFWRASDQMSRLDHKDLLQMLDGDLKGKDGFGIVSVDFDSKSDWWTTAIKDDKMTWTQVSDLKGDDSPNATNWAIAKIPTYFLVDGDWKIIERDFQLSELPLLVNRYLSKH
ncbi:MAG: TlpA family protein disulfide reductase [Mucilaginibacter sp.]